MVPAVMKKSSGAPGIGGCEFANSMSQAVPSIELCTVRFPFACSSVSQCATVPDVAGEPVPPPKSQDPQSPKYMVLSPGVLTVFEKLACQFGVWACTGPSVRMVSERIVIGASVANLVRFDIFIFQRAGMVSKFTWSFLHS
jgi:hypothetical protein